MEVKGRRMSSRPKMLLSLTARTLMRWMMMLLKLSQWFSARTVHLMMATKILWTMMMMRFPRAKERRGLNRSTTLGLMVDITTLTEMLLL